MSGYVGADPDQLDMLGRSLLAHAGGLEELRSSLGAQLFATGWAGPDASTTRADWETVDAPALGLAAELLRAMSQAAFLNAGQQRDASTADGQAAPGHVTAKQIPTAEQGPARIRSWWAGLSQEQRDYLIQHEPKRIGSLDGIAASDRDAANRVLLEQLRQREPHDAGLDDIHQRLTDPDRPHAYLLGLSTSGDGKAIVAINNPDESANVLTFVPGTGAELDKVGGEIERIDRLAADANWLDPTRQTSTILWLGYDAPDTLLDATNADYARDSSADLSRFQEGLGVTHQGTPSHNSVIGHSYGSTTVGIAARDEGLATNDMIFVGSPGVGVDHAGDLGIGAGHVWSSTAANDPIQYAVRLDFSGDLVHGMNPTQSGFGGQVFTSDPGTPLISTSNVSVGIPGFHVPGTPIDVPGVRVGIDVPTGIDPSAHSEYWDYRNESRSNIARIVTGNYDDVR